MNANSSGVAFLPSCIKEPLMPVRGNQELDQCPHCGSSEYAVSSGLQGFTAEPGAKELSVDIAGTQKLYLLPLCAYCAMEPDFAKFPLYRERCSCQCNKCHFEWDWMDDSIRKCSRLMPTD